LDRAGTLFTKKKYYDELASKFGRTAKSFEYRMQNISYVLSLMGRDWLTGLKPAKNVGANVASQIEELIADVEGKPVVPIVAFEIAVREDLSRKQLPQPLGNDDPKATTSTVTQYLRDSSVKAWVLKQANGVCECCSQQAPFSGSDGLPYLEVHHVRKLAEKGSDTTSNAIAVCPNCHRELHYGEQAKTLVERLYQSISRLIKE
jgi:5-methylcytosine-specific restriction protein A